MFELIHNTYYGLELVNRFNNDYGQWGEKWFDKWADNLIREYSTMWNTTYTSSGCSKQRKSTSSW